MTRYDLSDYAVSNIQDIISRVEGVGEVHDVRLPERHAHLAEPGAS